MKKPLKKMCFILLSIVYLTANGCQKREDKSLQTEDAAQKLEKEKELNERLLKFVSVTSGVKKDEVYFDEKSNNFIIKNTLKLNKDSVVKFYQTANVYKDQYENKK